MLKSIWMVCGVVFGLSGLGFNSAWAEDMTRLPASSFENQWEKPVVLNETVQWVIYTNSKQASGVVKDTFLALDMKDLVSYHTLYVADISGMPGLISRFIAIPKMKKYPFSIALVREESQTEHWPFREDAVTVFRLNRLQILQVRYFETLEKFKLFVAEKIRTNTHKS